MSAAQGCTSLLRRLHLRRGAAPSAVSTRLPALLRRLVIAYVPITAALAAAAAIDPRTLMGEPVWTKPLKFSASIGLNGAALLWLVRRSPAVPLVRGATVLSAAGLAVEQVLITLQAARGCAATSTPTPPSTPPSSRAWGPP